MSVSGSTLPRSQQDSIIKDFQSGMTINAIASKRKLSWTRVRTVVAEVDSSKRRTGRSSGDPDQTVTPIAAAAPNKPNTEVDIAILQAELSFIRDTLMLVLKRLAALGLT